MVFPIRRAGCIAPGFRNDTCRPISKSTISAVLQCRKIHELSIIISSIVRGVHPPWGHDVFPLFQIPPIFETFSESVQNFPNFTSSRKIVPFSSAKISDDFFLKKSPTNFEFPPVFSVLVHFPLFRENYYFPPTFKNFSPMFSTNSPAFYMLSVYLVPSYFDHDAFMHHPMHVLDAPEYSLFDSAAKWVFSHSQMHIIKSQMHIIKGDCPCWWWLSL